MAPGTLFVLPENAHTGKSFISTQFVLRSCNRDYRQESGVHMDSNLPPEFDNNKIPGKISPLRTFDNVHGHCFNGITHVFPPSHHDTWRSFRATLKHHISESAKKGYLWDLHNTVTVNIKTMSRSNIEYPIAFKRVMLQQLIKPYLPLSAHTSQAYSESLSKRGKDRTLYGIPSQSTIVTAMHAAIHNNQNLEMGFEEEEGSRDSIKRTYNKKHIGFICSGHTAHSADAGKSRRVTHNSRVRIVSKSIMNCISPFIAVSNSEADWIVYCMGMTCYCDFNNIRRIVYDIRNYSLTYFENQFVDFQSENLMCPPSYMIYSEDKVLYISISSGVVLRSLTDNSMVDSCMLYEQEPNTIISHPKLPAYGPEALKYKYSTFFAMAPFVEHNRPPRTLFASGQTTQAVLMPWSPATARVSPLHHSKPIVATEFVRKIEHDHEINPESIWDIFPGEDLVVCYMNTALNYEDSMLMSKSFADRGGFSTLSLCTYRVSESEDIPKVGEKLCGKKYKWWKMDCTDSCICKMPKHTSSFSTSGRVPSGKVHQVIRTEDGHISIKVLSFSQILTGDKISTMHGQKGIVRLESPENLPLIVPESGESFIADLYIAVGSIVSRQTNGQIYESAYGLKGAREGIMYTVDRPNDVSSEECKYLLHPLTGMPYMTQLPGNKIAMMKATYGITRIINQTQMTRERHHFTHKPETKYSTGTKSGRADGGGVAIGEMDFHAMFSSGLYSCAQELFNRGNACLINVCKNCKAIEILHDCGIEGNMVKVPMSFDTAVFDQISAVINGSCNRYAIEHS